MKLLVVVDMQKDFVDGSLGTPEAQSIVENVAKKIKEYRGNSDEVAFTFDAHPDNYLLTAEGKKLPVKHCINGTKGAQLDDRIIVEYKVTDPTFCKHTFGSVGLGEFLENKDYDEVEFVGLCTDICVISNVLLAKAFNPELNITVDASCCAGVTPETHNNALEAMKMCQITIKNYDWQRK